MTVHCCKDISPHATMHNNTSHSLYHLNKNLHDKAPCSIGVLVDRGNCRKFFGSTDDQEALVLRAFCDDRVSFKEVAVTNRERVLDMLWLLDNAYELVMIGRRHIESWLMTQIRKWDELGELGTIEEMLPSSEIKISALILVVQ
ncbi:hypothetical protein PanWU01x14_218320 [Parasponia andersonii]|uniref:Uncharacterized protein n=1 Tax=Parasponia andersonii TaxID=3476 RepID=A0A2P5BQP3_PARAD|nr:hypothetical protein PanWU01x14_218320 [Parasponia andersonii]